MVTAFQITLLFVIVISGIGTVGEKENKRLQENMAFLSAIAIAAFICAVVWL